MKQAVLCFILLISPYYVATATATTEKNLFPPSRVNVSDSMELFRNITDISRQVQRTVQSQDEQSVTVSQPAVQSSPSFEPPQDTVISIPIVPQQRTRPVIHLPSRNPLDSLYARKPNGTLQLPDLFYNTDAMRGRSFRDTLFYSPLFLPMIFTGNILPRDLSFYPPKEEASKGLLISREKTFAPQLADAEFVRNIRRQYYIDYPDRIKYSALHFDSIPPATMDSDIRSTFNPFRELIRSETTYSLEAPDVERVAIKRKYWIYSGEHSLQFSQNYFSDNWHKGGTSNMNINNYHVLKANYQKEKVRFNNTLEWRLSLYNAPEDSMRAYRIGEDLIRYYGDFGVDAFLKKWSYSANAEVKSQLFNNYVPNTNDLRSALLAPLYVNAGIGLKYSLDKKSETVRHRRVQLNLALAPISVNYKYVGNSAVDVARYGIPEGDKSLTDLGSTVTAILTYNVNRYITWDSRFKYFTSYDKIESEFENTLNMALSSYFSTRLYLHLRFDDGVPPDPKFKHLQINETVSFGLNFKW